MIESHSNVPTIIPANRIVSVPLVIRKNRPAPDTAKLQEQLKRKYAVERVYLAARNPVESGPSIQVFIIVYLLKEIFGPTLKQMVKDVYAYAKKQMAKKRGGKRLTIPRRFIHNGAAKRPPKRKKARERT